MLNHAILHTSYTTSRGGGAKSGRGGTTGKLRGGKLSNRQAEKVIWLHKKLSPTFHYNISGKNVDI
jgi:transcriptional regulator CtsR